MTVNTKILEELRLQRDGVYQQKRIKLLEYYGKLPQPMLDEGLNLIKQQESNLNDIEQKVRIFIDLLLKGDITLDKYIEFRNLVELGESKKGIIEPRKVTPIIKEEKSSIHENNKIKFCINCGAKLYSGNKFCTSCGIKL